MPDSLPLYPAYRQAARDAGKEFNFGETIKDEWLLPRLGFPETSDKMTTDEANKWSMARNKAIGDFKQGMLFQFNMHLERADNVGYRIVNPREQHIAALDNLKDAVRKASRKTGDILRCTDQSRLSQEESRQRTLVLEKLAATQAFSKKMLV